MNLGGRDTRNMAPAAGDGLSDTLAAMLKELDAGRTKFGAYASLHEAYGVLLEELDELWEVVKAKSGDGTPYETEFHRLKHAQREAIQLSAVSLRLAVELEIGLREAVEKQAGEIGRPDNDELGES